MNRKDTANFPLWLHKGTGQWCKTIRGKRHYFGEDREVALDRWLAQKDDLIAGRVPLRESGTLTVRDACNYYLGQQRHRVETGELRERTWVEYKATAERVVDHFGRSSSVRDLTPERFGEFRQVLAKGRGALALGREITQTRAIFRWVYDDGLLDQPVRFGRAFVKPGKKSRMAERNGRAPRFLDAEEIRAALDHADPQLHAMILLGVNAGLGNRDVAELRDRHIRDGWLDYPRPKTQVDRRCPLWPETLVALDAARTARPAPRCQEDADRVFLTKYRNPWVRYRPSGPIDSVAQEFRKLLDTVGVKRRGVGFYALRHVFQTIAEEVGDLPAVARVLGHSDPSMAGHYREWRRDKREAERLGRITEHVRAWLWPPADDASDGEE